MIEFRANRVDNAELVYGYYVEANQNKHYLVQMNCFCELLPFATHEVVPNTIEFKVGKLWFSLALFEEMAKQSREYKKKLAEDGK